MSSPTHPATVTAPFDVATYLRTPEEAAAYLTEVLKEEDAAEFRRALGDVARSASMKAVAERAGVGYQSLYKSLSETGNPSFDTVMRVMSALGLGMAAVIKPGREPEAA